MADPADLQVELRGGPSNGMRITVEPELTEVSVPGTGAEAPHLLWATYRPTRERTADGIPIWEIAVDG
jgi:hypothetical protein